MSTSSSDAPLVTVVMPAFNEERYVGEAIAGVLSQTHANLELIAVDDGSTDRTPQIIREYAARDPRVRYHRQPNGGQSAARNAAIGLARGRYIAYQDADDLSCPGRIAAELALLRGRPGVGAVYCGMDIVDAGGRFVKSVPARAFDARRLLLGNYICCGSVLHERALLDRSGPWGDDIDWGMWLRMSEHAAFDRVAAPLYRYRLHGGNLSATRGWIGNRRIEIAIFEERHRRRGDPFARWKARSLRWQVAAVSRIPGARANRYVLYAVGRLFGVAEAIAYGLTGRPGAASTPAPACRG